MMTSSVVRLKTMPKESLVFEILSIFKSAEEDGSIVDVEDKETFSVGDVLDTRKTNRDFRRWAARIRRINKDGTALVEYTDGQMFVYNIDSGVKKMPLSELKKFLTLLDANIEKGALAGPTITKVRHTLERWIKKYQKHKK